MTPVALHPAFETLNTFISELKSIEPLYRLEKVISIRLFLSSDNDDYDDEKPSSSSLLQHILSTDLPSLLMDFFNNNEISSSVSDSFEGNDDMLLSESILILSMLCDFCLLPEDAKEDQGDGDAVSCHYVRSFHPFLTVTLLPFLLSVLRKPNMSSIITHQILDFFSQFVEKNDFPSIRQFFLDRNIVSSICKELDFHTDLSCSTSLSLLRMIASSISSFSSFHPERIRKLYPVVEQLIMESEDDTIIDSMLLVLKKWVLQCHGQVFLSENIISYISDHFCTLIEEEMSEKLIRSGLAPAAEEVAAAAAEEQEQEATPPAYAAVDGVVAAAAAAGPSSEDYIQHFEIDENQEAEDVNPLIERAMVILRILGGASIHSQRTKPWISTMRNAAMGDAAMTQYSEFLIKICVKLNASFNRVRSFEGFDQNRELKARFDQMTQEASLVTGLVSAFSHVPGEENCSYSEPCQSYVHHTALKTIHGMMRNKSTKLQVEAARYLSILMQSEAESGCEFHASLLMTSGVAGTLLSNFSAMENRQRSYFDQSQFTAAITDYFGAIQTLKHVLPRIPGGSHVHTLVRLLHTSPSIQIVEQVLHVLQQFPDNFHSNVTLIDGFDHFLRQFEREFSPFFSSPESRALDYSVYTISDLCLQIVSSSVSYSPPPVALGANPSLPLAAAPASRPTIDWDHLVPIICSISSLLMKFQTEVSSEYLDDIFSFLYKYAEKTGESSNFLQVLITSGLFTALIQYISVRSAPACPDVVDVLSLALEHSHSVPLEYQKQAFNLATLNVFLAMLKNPKNHEAVSALLCLGMSLGPEVAFQILDSELVSFCVQQVTSGADISFASIIKDLIQHARIDQLIVLLEKGVVEAFCMILANPDSWKLMEAPLNGLDAMLQTMLEGHDSDILEDYRRRFTEIGGLEILSELQGYYHTHQAMGDDLEESEQPDDQFLAMSRLGETADKILSQIFSV